MQRTYALRHLLAVIALSLVPAVSLAHGNDKDDAQRHQSRMDRLFEHFDKDHDGRIAVKDLPDRLREKLSKADANNDGQLTRPELEQAFQQRREEMKKLMDENGDGVISEQERVKARDKFWTERFTRLDKNGDGAITASEVPSRIWDHLKVADANNDGRLTKVEIDQARASGKLRPTHPHGEREH